MITNVSKENNLGLSDIIRYIWGVRQWFRTAEPLGERRNGNWNTHTQFLFCKAQLVRTIFLYPY